MAAKFIDLDSADKLDALFHESHTAPVLIFKHSSSCVISSGVIKVVESLDSEINLVVVQRDRVISNFIAERTGIRHESPQAIVISNGRPVYSASHWDIETDRIEAFLGDSKAAGTTHDG